MSVPTVGETFARLTEYLRKAQEEAATLAHLENANDHRQQAIAWLAVSEKFKKTLYIVTEIAKGKLQ